MKAAGIEVFGVADYNETLPGTGFKQRELFDGIQSVIVCLIPWDTGMNEGRNVARYAVGRNYHDVAAEHLSVATEILKRAFPEETFKFFVDSSPVAEVRAAVLAGLGVRGKNNLLISKEYGTRCAIGEIITTRKFAKSKKSVGGCFDCGKCIKACPNGARIYQPDEKGTYPRGRSAYQKSRLYLRMRLLHRLLPHEQTCGWHRT